MTDILIVGAGGHARVVADLVRLSGTYRICGFLDDNAPERRGSAYEASTILGGIEALPELRGQVAHAVIAIGDNDARLGVAEQLAAHGYSLATLIHPTATVAASAVIGPGTVIMAGAIINAATVIGGNVIINTAATVDHDCRIADGAHIGPGTHLGGHITVGRAALLGVGCAVKPGISIGAGAVVGVGAAVVSDVEPRRTVAGVPARVLS